jgi:hypothetical protein
MIVRGNGTLPGNRGGDRRVDALQPRGRAAGDGRQAHPPHRAPAPGAGAQPAQTSALAGRHGTVAARLAAASRGAAAGTARRGPADDGHGPARAAVLRPAHAGRARRPARAHCDVRDRTRRGRHGTVRACALEHPHQRPDRHARARRARPLDSRALHRQPRAPASGLADDDRGGTWLCLERRGHEAVLRRPLSRTPLVRGRLGAFDGRRISRGGAQRDERLADAPGNPGGAGRVRDSDDRAGDGGAAAARRILQLDPARRGAHLAVAGGAGRRGRRAGALAPLARLDGRRGRQRAQGLDR